jgi:CBS domain-containing protein
MPAQRPTHEPATVDGFPRQAWSTIPVDQVMRGRVLTCSHLTQAREVARTMVTHAVHAVVVVDDDGRMTGTVSDEAILRAALEGHGGSAGELADGRTPAVRTGVSVEDAARAMVRTGGTHVVVIDGRGVPIGMISTLDLARIMVWGHV